MTTPLPIRAGDAVDFTPESLKSIASPPVFKLRWATRDDRRKADIVGARAGVVRHSVNDLRREILDVTKANMDPEDYATTKTKLLAYWKGVDEHAEAKAKYEGDDEFPEFEHPDARAADELWDRCTEASGRFRVMLADNERYIQGLCETWFRVLCSGWSGIDVEYRQLDGAIPEDDLDLILQAVTELEGVADDAAGTALAQLFVGAYNLRGLPDAARKNSSSLPPSSEIQSTSETTTDSAATSESGSSTESKESSDAATQKT